MSAQRERIAPMPKAEPKGRDPWRNRMTVDRIVHTFAGTLILASLALAHWHSPGWLWLTAFVGANLFQSGLTNWCLVSRLLTRAGLPAGRTCGLKG